MPNIITVKIDVKKLDKARFFPGKNGALYCDLVLIPMKEQGRFGDTHLVKQSATKEERQQRVQLPIVGNATEKTPRGDGYQEDAPSERAPAPRTPPRRTPPPAQPAQPDPGDVPF
jgi:hypothetical protein